MTKKELDCLGWCVIGLLKTNIPQWEKDKIKTAYDKLFFTKKKKAIKCKQEK